MDGRDVAVVLTGVGKRYDIVSAFSAHAFTIAVDPSPLAPARYAADVAVVPPRIDDPAYVPFLQEIVARYDARAVVPLTDLDLEVLARRRPAGVRPQRRGRAGDVRQVRDARAAAAASDSRARRRACPRRSPRATR